MQPSVLGESVSKRGISCMFPRLEPHLLDLIQQLYNGADGELDKASLLQGKEVCIPDKGCLRVV